MRCVLLRNNARVTVLLDTGPSRPNAMKCTQKGTKDFLDKRDPLFPLDTLSMKRYLA